MEAKANYSKKLLKTLKRVENEIAENSREIVVGITREGKEVFRIIGGETSVSFIKEAMDRDRLNSRLIVTHNHPTNVSFSRPDILAMKRANLYEVRAVTKEYLYTARFTKSITMDVGMLNEFILDMEHWVRLNFNALIKSGKLTYASAGAKHWHEVWTSLEKKTDWFYYKRVRRIKK